MKIMMLSQVYSDLWVLRDQLEKISLYVIQSDTALDSNLQTHKEVISAFKVSSMPLKLPKWNSNNCHQWDPNAWPVPHINSAPLNNHPFCRVFKHLHACNNACKLKGHWNILFLIWIMFNTSCTYAADLV